MEKIIEQHKSGQYTLGESAKIMSEEEIDNLQRTLEESENKIEDLIKEN